MNLNEKISIIGKNKEEFILRRLLLSDRVTLQKFGKSLSERSTSTFLPHTYDDKTIDTLLLRSEEGKDLIMGLFHKEIMVAYLFLWYFDELIPLLGIGILDEYQGQGLSKKLMQVLIDKARKNECDGIELTTLPDNHVAYSLYESMGFKHYADVENVAGDGRIFIERAMFLQFGPNVNPSVEQHKPPVNFTNKTE